MRVSTNFIGVSVGSFPEVIASVIGLVTLSRHHLGRGESAGNDLMIFVTVLT